MIGWDEMEKYTYILGLIPVFICFIYLLLFEQDLNIIRCLKKQEQKYYANIYQEFDFDIEKLQETNAEIEKLNIEIRRLRNR